MHTLTFSVERATILPSGDALSESTRPNGCASSHAYIFSNCTAAATAAFWSSRTGVRSFQTLSWIKKTSGWKKEKPQLKSKKSCSNNLSVKRIARMRVLLCIVYARWGENLCASVCGGQRILYLRWSWLFNHLNAMCARGHIAVIIYPFFWVHASCNSTYNTFPEAVPVTSVKEVGARAFSYSVCTAAGSCDRRQRKG